MKKFCPLLVILFLIISNSCSKKKKSSKEIDPRIGQELLFITQEFESKNYENVIKFVEDFFEKNEINQESVQILFKKGEALQKLAQKLNKKYSKENIKIAKKYGLKIKNKKIYYDYKDFKIISEKFPDIQIGKKSFKIWYASLTNINDKISALEDYIKRVKNKSNLQLELSDLYIEKLFAHNNEKISDKLIKLYKEIINSASNPKEKSIAFINKNILLLSKQKDLSKIEEEILTFKCKLPLYNSIKYYMLGEIAFLDERLEKANKFFKKSLKFIKKVENNSKEIPSLLVKFESLPDSTLKTFKQEIIKKIALIKSLISYRKNLVDKKIAFITGKRVRIRKTPYVGKKNIITSLNYGDKVIIIERSDKPYEVKGKRNYWYKVELKDGTIGWIFGQYLTSFLINKE